MKIYTNAPVNSPAYLLDRNGDPITIDLGSTYRCSLKKAKGDTDAVLTFVSGGGNDIGNISIIHDVIEGEIRDLFVFGAPQSLVADLEPGLYYADLLRLDDPEWKMSFEVAVEEGITAP